MAHPVSIASSDWQLWLDPAKGMQWLALQLRRGGNWIDICPDCRPTVTGTPHALAAANFHMLPYSNRIRDGRFRFQGRSHVLADGQNHAIHGALCQRPWRLVEHLADTVRAVYDSTLDGALNWPWPLQAVIDYHLRGPVLVGTLTLTNAGRTPMPAGLGWHPYFVRTINGAQPMLMLPVDSVYPDDNGDCLPIGPALPVPPSLDFTTPRTLEPTQRIDHCFAGLAGGACHISWPAADVSLVLRASDACRHLVLFNPDQPYFAVEPVSNANDGVNLQEAGIDAGIVTLEPGASLSASLCLSSDFTRSSLRDRPQGA